MPTKTSDTAKKSARKIEYENNPFKLALDGLNLVFNKARGIAVLLVVISVFMSFSGVVNRGDRADHHTPFAPVIPHLTPEQWMVGSVMALIMILAFVFITSMISGISAYASSRIARGHNVELNEAFHAVLERFFSYIWLQVIQFVKIILWSLLFIVPGIIMAVRYSLANVAFFDKDLKGNAAIKHSLSLTRGAWLTTFASQSLFNIITLGVIGELVTAGSRSVLYRQLDQFKDGDKKPDAHVLSWITLFLPFAIILLIIMLTIAFVILAAAIGGMHFGA